MNSRHLRKISKREKDESEERIQEIVRIELLPLKARMKPESRYRGYDHHHMPRELR
jgi:hypothetical protein